MRQVVLPLMAVVLAGVMYVVEPVNAVLEGNTLDGVQVAQAAAPAGGPAGGITPAPAFRSASNPLALQSYDRVLGVSKAPVTIIEYASLTCTHCRDFHIKTLPQVQKEWIMTGKARYVLRDMPWDNMALGMSAVARCAPAQSFYPLVNGLFGSQEAIFNAGDKVGAIAQVAKVAGLNRKQVEACIQDPAYQKLSTGMKTDAQAKLKVNGTPTFFVNGERIDGFMEYKDLQPILQKAYDKAAR